MAFLTSKWFLLLIATIVVILVGMYIAGHKVVHTEIDIAAPPEKVWSVLMDKSGYSEWNPVLIPIEGELKQDESLIYRMIEPGGKEYQVKTKVVSLIENQLLNQFGGVQGFLTFDHKYQLEKTEEGTRLIQHEEYRGIGVLFWDPQWVLRAYNQANQNLKSRVDN